MKIRYAGSDPGGVDVACSGRLIAADVMPDDVVEVPDEVYRAHGWSEELWTVVEPPAALPEQEPSPARSAPKKKAGES